MHSAVCSHYTNLCYRSKKVKIFGNIYIILTCIVTYVATTLICVTVVRRLRCSFALCHSHLLFSYSSCHLDDRWMWHDNSAWKRNHVFCQNERREQQTCVEGEKHDVETSSNKNMKNSVLDGNRCLLSKTNIDGTRGLCNREVMVLSKRKFYIIILIVDATTSPLKSYIWLWKKQLCVVVWLCEGEFCLWGSWEGWGRWKKGASKEIREGLFIEIFILPFIERTYQKVWGFKLWNLGNERENTISERTFQNH